MFRSRDDARMSSQAAAASGRRVSLARFVQSVQKADLSTGGKKPLGGRLDAARILAGKRGCAPHGTRHTPRGTRHAANGKRQTANGKRQTANGKRQTANGKRQTANRKRQTANGKPQTANRKRQTANGKPQTANGSCGAHEPFDPAHQVRRS